MEALYRVYQHNGQDTVYDNDSELFRYRPEKLNDITQQQSHKLLPPPWNWQKSCNQGGVIYIFGCGHSHIFAEDVFYQSRRNRPGSANTYRTFNVTSGAAASSYYENRMTILLSIWRFSITSKDALIVISTSGLTRSGRCSTLGKTARGIYPGADQLLYAETQPSKQGWP